MGLAIEMFTDEQVMEYAGGTVAKEKIIAEMAMQQRSLTVYCNLHLRAHPLRKSWP